MEPGSIGDYIPQLRPHYRRQGCQLYFMISTRPTLELSPEDVALYEEVDGRRSVSVLARTHVRAVARLQAWDAAGILDLIPPIHAPAGPHLVVVEPHMDDAALSVGGRLLHRRGRCRITILSVVRWSNFTSYLYLKRDFLDVRVITELRLQESSRVARLLGATHRCLDWTDAPIRIGPVTRWSPETTARFVEHREPFVSLPPDPREVSALARRLGQEVEHLAPDELWIPMGLGDHVDHRLTRSASVAMLAAAGDRLSRVRVAMYEDLPYDMTGNHAVQIQRAFAAVGTRLPGRIEDVTDVFEEKLRLVSVYASQFKVSAMEPRLRECAEHRAGVTTGRLAEAFYEVEGAIRLPLESRLSPDWHRQSRLWTEIGALLARRRACGRVAVLALPTAHLGRWKAAQESLLGSFPNARIHVYVSDEIEWQAAGGVGGGGGRLVFEVVRGGYGGWLRLLLREGVHFGTPTIVLWHGAWDGGRGFKAGFLRRALPLRPVLLGRRLCDFCAMLDEHRDRGDASVA